VFVDSILRTDRSVVDLLTATTLRERAAARHYGIPNVYGDHFRRVTLTNQAVSGCSVRAAPDADFVPRSNLAGDSGQVGDGRTSSGRRHRIRRRTCHRS